MLDDGETVTTDNRRPQVGKGEEAPERDGKALSLRDIDNDALKVVRKLLAAGHEAFLVGGCVRDLYLSRKPKDFDVATSARPEQIRRVFRNSRIIGRRFKLAHVYFAVRPEKWWITRSMLLGWITRRQYLEHHEPERWRAVANPPAGRT